MPDAPPDEAVSPEAPPPRPDVPPPLDVPPPQLDVPPPRPDGHSPTAGPRRATFRVMDVLSVSVDLPAQYPTVHLQEAEPPLRDLTFPIGLPEGVALAQALRRVATPRPLTHELFTTALQQLGADIATVRLVGRRGGTYLAELVLSGPRGTVTLPCRPSDGIILALRQPVAAPVVADERLLEGPGDVTPPDEGGLGVVDRVDEGDRSMPEDPADEEGRGDPTGRSASA